MQIFNLSIVKGGQQYLQTGTSFSWKYITVIGTYFCFLVISSVSMQSSYITIASKIIKDSVLFATLLLVAFALSIRYYKLLERAVT